MQTATEPSPPAASLTPRQVQIVRLMADGLRYAEIADELGLSAFTVRNYVERIFERLGVYSRAGAVGRSLRDGLLD
ncbi:MAG TPA: LuxR C-terminal-related transcriptional regulator [Actinomycetota bacterium]|nr:LuxR C-terminal-related transcriptional regulator [Actinomycetota bacterium]